jgi:hypothetical protein
METFKFVVKVNGKKYDTSIKNIYNKSLKERTEKGRPR